MGAGGAADTFFADCLRAGPPDIPTLPTPEPSGIQGYVVDEAAALFLMRLCVSRQPHNIPLLGADGKFYFKGLTKGPAVKLTAWAEGYYIGGGNKIPGFHRMSIFFAGI